MKNEDRQQRFRVVNSIKCNDREHQSEFVCLLVIIPGQTIALASWAYKSVTSAMVGPKICWIRRIYLVRIDQDVSSWSPGASGMGSLPSSATKRQGVRSEKVELSRLGASNLRCKPISLSQEYGIQISVTRSSSIRFFSA